MENKSPAWDDLRVLLAVHRHRSFLAAGRALGVSTSTAARRIGALERSLRRTLVHRGTDGTKVDAKALPLVALAEQVEQGLDSTRRDQAGPAELAGTVRVSVGEGFVRPIARLLAEFRRTHPETQVELVSETRLADLARREADVGIRTVRSSSTVLVQKSIGALRFGLFAAEDYVERRIPSRRLDPKDFANHDYVGYEGGLGSLPQQRWLLRNGAARFPFRSNSDLAILEATLRGQGITVLAEAVARDQTGLVRLDVAGGPPAMSVFVVFHRELRGVARIQRIAAHLDRGLGLRTRSHQE
jgi:DNA-binding transcriptional LysR family regulator